MFKSRVTEFNSDWLTMAARRMKMSNSELFEVALFEYFLPALKKNNYKLPLSSGEPQRKIYKNKEDDPYFYSEEMNRQDPMGNRFLIS